MPAKRTIVIWEKNGRVKFSPSTLNVSAGDQVSWSNQTDQDHTIVIEGIPAKVVSWGAHDTLSAGYTIPASIKYWRQDHEDEKGTISIETEEGYPEVLTIKISAGVFDPDPLQAWTDYVVQWSDDSFSKRPIVIPSQTLSTSPTSVTALPAPRWDVSQPFTILKTIPYARDARTGSITIIAVPVRGPSITGTSPITCRLPAGGQEITLTGTNLRNGQVTVNGNVATIINNSVDTKLVFTTPKGTAGSWAEVIVTVDSLTAQTVFAYAPDTPTITPPGPLCLDGRVELKSNSASGNQWYRNGAAILGATKQTYLASEKGNYTVKVTIGKECAKDSKEVIINPLPAATITASGPTTFCQGGKVTLTASAGSSYSWSTLATTQSITVNTSGNYHVTVQDANGCSATSADTIVTVNPLPVATITAEGPTTFCQGGRVTLTASPGSSYSWSTLATTQSITVNTSGNYHVTVKDRNGCSATSADTIVTVNPLPVATITAEGPTTFCQGGSVTLTASPALLYSWSTHETTQSITVTTSGNYHVTVKDANGCSATSAETIVTVNPLPVVTFIADGPTTFCQGGSVTLTVFVDGKKTTSQTYNTTGSHVATYRDLNGCLGTSDPVYVTVNPNPNATIKAPSIVPANATDQTASVADAGADATYAWVITDGTITAGSGTADITFTAGTVGTLTLQCTVTTSCGCDDTKSQSVEVVAHSPD